MTRPTDTHRIPSRSNSAPGPRTTFGTWSRSRFTQLVTLTLSLILAGVGTAAASYVAPPEKLTVDIQKSILLDLGQKVETVSITDTDIADFVVAAQTQVLIHGKKLGETSLVVWVEGGDHRRYDLVVRRGHRVQQIKLNVRVAELSKTALTEFGIDYLARLFNAGAGEDRAAGAYPGAIGKPAIPLSAGSLPEYPDDADIVLRWIKGTEQYEAIIHALEQDGLIKVLARPNLVCLDGEKASFLAGGEIPIPVAQTSSTGGTTITIEWREFGVRLNFTPTIIDSSLINLEVAPEISNLDFNNAVEVGGFRVPALSTRKAATRVELEDGQSLILGGLRATSVRDVQSRIPVLGHIPLLGKLFTSISKASEENELLLVVSPTVVEPVDTEPEIPWESSKAGN